MFNFFIFICFAVVASRVSPMAQCKQTAEGCSSSLHNAEQACPRRGQAVLHGYTWKAWTTGRNIEAGWSSDGRATDWEGLSEQGRKSFTAEISFKLLCIAVKSLCVLASHVFLFHNQQHHSLEFRIREQPRIRHTVKVQLLAEGACVRVQMFSGQLDPMVFGLAGKQ